MMSRMTLLVVALGVSTSTTLGQVAPGTKVPNTADLLREIDAFLRQFPPAERPRVHYLNTLECVEPIPPGGKPKRMTPPTRQQLLKALQQQLADRRDKTLPWQSSIDEMRYVLSKHTTELQPERFYSYLGKGQLCEETWTYTVHYVEVQTCGPHLRKHHRTETLILYDARLHLILPPDWQQQIDQLYKDVTGMGK